MCLQSLCVEFLKPRKWRKHYAGLWRGGAQAVPSIMYESIHYFTILLVFSKDFVSRVSCFLRQTKLLGNIICCFRYPGKFLTTTKEQRFWRSDRSKNGNQCGIFVKLVVHLLPCGLRDPVTSNLLSCKFTSYVRIQHHGVIYENYEQKKIDAFKQYTNLFEVLIQWVQSV